MRAHVQTATFVADDGWSWKFDVSFFASGHQCIWGQGCPSTHPSIHAGTDSANAGCCVFGVFVVDDEDDAQGMADYEQVVKPAVAKLTDEQWQNKAIAEARGGAFKRRGDAASVHTRVHRNACIFFNRADFPTGAGCALHQASLARGEAPEDGKPETCWVEPLTFVPDPDERQTFVTVASNLQDWGAGGEESLEWWCADAPIAYSAERAAYRTYAGTLARKVPAAILAAFNEYMDDYMSHHAVDRTPVNFLGIDGAREPDGTTGIALPMAS